MKMVTKLPTKQAQDALVQLEIAWSYYMPQPMLVQGVEKTLAVEPKVQADHFHSAA